MSITSLTPPEKTIAQPRHSGQAGLLRLEGRTGRHPADPDPGSEKMRGLRLVAVWVGLTAASWAVLGGAGYGLYAVVGSLLP